MNVMSTVYREAGDDSKAFGCWWEPEAEASLSSLESGIVLSVQRESQSRVLWIKKTGSPVLTEPVPLCSRVILPANCPSPRSQVHSPDVA